MFMSLYHRVRYCRPVTGLILVQDGLWRPGLGRQTHRLHKGPRSGTPEAIRRHVLCFAGNERLRQSEAVASRFLNRLPRKDAPEPVGALQIARQTRFMASRRPRKCRGALQRPSSNNHATEKFLDTFQLPARSITSTATLFGALLPAGGVTLFAGKPVIVTSWVVPQAAELSISSVVQKL
jgi:hypothetical protein